MSCNFPISNSVNFEPRYEKSWHEAECDGNYKSVGSLHYEVDSKCKVMVWNDKVTNKKRWWFGLSFDNKKSLHKFIKTFSKKIFPHFNEKGFNEEWLNFLITEKWKNEKEYYLGVYAKKGKETEAIKLISDISKKFDIFEYFKLNKKYGEGEGKDHLELKEYIFNNPHKIGINNLSDKKMEYSFKYTGDRVDILFTQKTGKDIVVEIETNNALPGFHQTIKYRSLRCVEMNLSLDSKNVLACLVAWNISGNTKKLCKTYGIKYYEIRP